MEKCHQTGSFFLFLIRLLTKLPHLLHILEILGVHGRSHEEMEKKVITEKLDGSYVLKTDRKDLTVEEIWRTYILLTRVEDVFRDMKSPLMEPNFPSPGKPDADAYLSVRLGLPPAGCD